VSAGLQRRVDDLRDPAVVALLEEHLADMRLHSPPESVHALDLDGLRAPSVTFWSVWRGDALVGCCALNELDALHGELKSMRSATAHRGTGVGAWMLAQLLDEARRRGYRRLSLETGSMAAFEPARRLYAGRGFRDCPPFADYLPDPYSRFMTLELAP
jgi:putative acetyltransferase